MMLVEELDTHFRCGKGMTVTLTPEQIEAVQNALSFAVWQFPKGGDDDLDRQATILSKLHQQIREETKVKGRY